MTSDPLSTLEAHFRSIERFPIAIPGVPGKFYSKPLTFEESLRLVHALREQEPAKQARKHAELIVAKVETEEEHRAFLGDKHFKAEERLVRACPPAAISAIIEQFQEHIEAAALDLEKKSETPEETS